ncbi:hypothetical protein [Fredinandcohnia onubensis]|uniref:hypothetical protein n=1 Tax=Fredinandcohnia onubensis TaxID=1571209 RepID=UPI000C0BF86C|nr:hypothetical protein [Fredinandcohnia onubensis]
MKKYSVAKFLGILVGVLTLLGALGFLVFSLLGTSLGKALNSQIEYSLIGPLLITALLISVGFVTIIGARKLSNNTWRKFYIVFCMVIGFGLTISFFITFGAIGTTNEIFILCVGLIYLALGHTASR